jgi:hypothetical protein
VTVNRSASALALLAFTLLAVVPAPVHACPSDDAAAVSAARISAELDRAIRETQLRIAVAHAARHGTQPSGVIVSPDGLLFIDGPEVPFEYVDWTESVENRGRRHPTTTDTTLRVGPGMTLALSNLAGDISVTAWDRNEVRVQAEHDRGDRLIAEVRDATVRLGMSSSESSPAEVEWMLTVPAWLPLELSGVECDIMVSGMKSSVRAQNMRGDISVDACQGPLEANSVEGEVHVSNSRGTVTAGSINSIVRIVRATGPVEAQTINGDIQLVKVESPNVDASTVNGRVYYASGYQPRGRYLFSSHNGKLFVPMPDDQHVKVSMSSFQGEVESSIPVPNPAPAPRERGRHFRFVVQDGVAWPDPVTAPPTPSTPRAPRAPSAPQGVTAAAAPEIELESFGGLIRLASQEEVARVLAAQRNILSVRRAGLDSARVHQLRGRGEMDRARRLERQAKAREDERRRPAPPRAPTPEAPPPPPGRD